MKLKGYLLLFVLTFCFLSGSFQEIQAQAKGYVGLLGGMSVPSYDGTTSRVDQGLVGGVRLDGELGIGAYVITSAKNENINNSTISFDYELYGIEGSFHFEGVADGAFVGLRVGTTKLNYGKQLKTSPTHYGLIFGYDKMINDWFSFGVEGSWLGVESSTQNLTEVKPFNILGFNATVKCWF